MDRLVNGMQLFNSPHLLWQDVVDESWRIGIVGFLIYRFPFNEDFGPYMRFKIVFRDDEIPWISIDKDG